MSVLIFDADDTLWENNIYFEAAFDDFVQFLAHSSLTPPQVRDVLNEIEATPMTTNETTSMTRAVAITNSQRWSKTSMKTSATSTIAVISKSRRRKSAVFR